MSTALVTNEGSRSVSAIDLGTMTVVATIPCGHEPIEVLVPPAGTHAIVSLHGGPGELAVIDLQTHQVAQSIPVGTTPTHMRLTPDGQEAWVGNDGAASVTAFSPTTFEPITTIGTGAGHHKLAFTRDGRFAIVTNIAENTVTLIDRRTMAPTHTIAVHTLPHGVAVTPDDQFAYIGNARADRISVIEIESGRVAAEVTGLDRPNYQAVGPDGLMWSIGPREAVRIDPGTHTVVDCLPVGPGPTRIAFARDGSWAAIPDREASQAWIIGTAPPAVRSVIDLPGQSAHRGLAISPDDRYIVCPNGSAHSVSIIDTATGAVAEIPTGRDPLGAAFTPAP